MLVLRPSADTISLEVSGAVGCRLDDLVVLADLATVDYGNEVAERARTG